MHGEMFERLQNWFGWGGVAVGHKAAVADAVATDETINPVSELQAMRVPAFNAAVTLLSDCISILPLRLKRRTDAGAEVVTNHPVAQVLRDPDSKRPTFTGQEMIRCLVQSLSIHGNAFMEQVRVRNKEQLYSLRLIDPCRVNMKVTNGAPVYHIYPRAEDGGQSAGVESTLEPPDILHFKGAYMDSEGYTGISSLVTLRDALRVNIEQQRHARRSLVGGNVKGFVTYLQELTAEQQKDVSSLVNSKDSDQKWKVLFGDPKISVPTLTNQGAQFIEGRNAQLLEIARFFRIPPYLLMYVVGISNWGSGLSQQGTSFIAYTLLPIAQRIEAVMIESLLTPQEREQGYFLDFDFGNLSRGSPAERASYSQSGIASGWLSPAEARSIEGMNEVEGLDNYKPVDAVSLPPGPAPAPNPEPQPNGE